VGRPSTSKVLAVVLPLVITTLLWVLAKFRDGFNLLGLTAADAVTQITALYSIVLMSIALLITTRSRAIERLYGGLDRSYRLHARLGEVALVLLVVHLLTLIPRHLGQSVRSLFVPFVDTWPKSFATVAFWMFVVLAVLTLWKKLSYQKWLACHAWMGLPFVLSSVHAFGADSDLRGYEPLRTWMLLWVILGAGAWMYRTFFYQGAGLRYHYVADQMSDRGGGIWDLVLRPTTVRMNYEPGKFAFISVTNHPEIPAEHHPFSISSSPVHRKLRFSFKVRGDYTTVLPNLHKGNKVEVYGPFGDFTLHQFGLHRRFIWIGGGIGIAPFLSMLAFEETNDDFRKIWLFYCVRRDADAVYHDEIEKYVNVADSYVDYVKWVSDERGPLTAHAILDFTGPIDDYAVMMCAPPQMMRSFKKQFIRAGLPANRIIFEDFHFR
jgi:predicted ferric reductase